jgi:hypothetical protein
VHPGKPRHRKANPIACCQRPGSRSEFKTCSAAGLGCSAASLS